MTKLVDVGSISRRELSRLTFPAYVTGGVLLTLAAVFNPFSHSLILLSGVGASVGLTWGMLFIPQIVTIRTQPRTAGAFQSMSFSWAWTTLAGVVAVVFIAVLGPGIRFA